MSRLGPRLGLALALALGCASDLGKTQPAGVDADGPQEHLDPAAQIEPTATPASSATASRPVVLITDPAELARLPAGTDFAGLVFDAPGASTQELHERIDYRSMINELELTGGYADFIFQRWWLNAPTTSLTLVGVANRIDRRDFGATGCGETRLLYRLGYVDAGGSEATVQRLPAAFNVVYEQPDDGQGCASVARTWMVPEGEDPIAFLTREGGPLHPSMLTRDRLLALETNIRIAERNDAGGRNELRVFAWDREAERLRPIGLEFQPAYKTMLVRRQVRELLTPESLAVIERGAGQLPLQTQEWAHVEANEFVSWDEYREMWRRFDANDEPTPLAAEGLTSTRAGVEFRLRGMSCTGCHATRSVAGFHLPGEGSSERLRGGASAHLLAELPWRERYVEALAAGREPERTRKLHDDGPGGFGRHCSVEGSPYPAHACDDGFECREVSGAEFGVCLPREYAGPGPCDERGASCQRPSPWFPGGFEWLGCTGGQPCARVPVTTDVSGCKDEADIWACAEQRADQTRVDGCEQQSDCRDGYVCVDGEGGATGACLPSAALAEFRLLGHRTRLR